MPFQLPPAGTAPPFGRPMPVAVQPGQEPAPPVRGGPGYSATGGQPYNPFAALPPTTAPVPYGQQQPAPQPVDVSNEYTKPTPTFAGVMNTTPSPFRGYLKGGIGTQVPAGPTIRGNGMPNPVGPPPLMGTNPQFNRIRDVAPDSDWVDAYNGDVDNIGVNPYSLSAASPAVTQSQGNQANPLAGLAHALSQYGGGQQQTPFPADQVVPGYTDPLGVVPDYGNMYGSGTGE